MLDPILDVDLLKNSCFLQYYGTGVFIYKGNIISKNQVLVFQPIGHI